MRFSLLTFCFSAVVASCFALDIQVETPYAVLMDVESGDVLFEKNAHARIFPASTMKLASILYVLEDEEIDLDELATVVPDALKMTSEREKKATNYNVVPYYLEPDGTMAYIRKNEKLSLRSLIFASLMKSANDATNALANHISGSIPKFVDDLNARVKELGLTSTHFVNPHGLHHPDHYSTAYEIAQIGRLLYHNPKFMEIALQRVYHKPKTNLQKEERWKNFSSLLKENNELFYSKALFAKTGFMKAAKFNLVAAATNGERTLVAALHKSPNWKQRYLDVIHMFESAFQEKKVKRTLFLKEETKFEKMIPKGDKPLLAVLGDDVHLEYFSSQEPKVQANLHWNQELSLPVKEGDIVAGIEMVSEKGKTLLEVPLYAKYQVSKKRLIKKKWLLGILPIALPFGVILFFRRRNNPK